MKSSIVIWETLILAVVLPTLAGCSPIDRSQTAIITITPSAPTPHPPGGPTLEPYAFKTSDAAYATLHGYLVVLDPTTILPGPDDAIYLVPMESGSVTTIPQFVEGNVPQAEVDERTGEFVFTNVRPGTYAVVVMTNGGAQIPARKMEDKNLAIFTFNQADVNNTVELGGLSLP